MGRTKRSLSVTVAPPDPMAGGTQPSHDFHHQPHTITNTNNNNPSSTNPQLSSISSTSSSSISDSVGSSVLESNGLHKDGIITGDVPRRPVVNHSTSLSDLMGERNEAQERNGDREVEFELSDFEIGTIAGYGSEALVKKATHLGSGASYALKVFFHPQSRRSSSVSQSSSVVAPNTIPTKHLPPTAVLPAHLRNELRHLRHLPHPNVLRYHTAFFAPDQAMILMEFADMGSVASLLHRIGALPMSMVASLMAQVTSGLAHLHEQCCLLHCDLKPSNLLLSSPNNGQDPLMVKISDFGVSMPSVGEGSPLDPEAFTFDPSKCDDEHEMASKRTTQGSTLYMSPERVRSEPFGPSADIWSLGLTCAELAVGVFPLLSTDFDDDEQWDDEMAHENPFVEPVNVFDINTMVADNRASVQWDRLFYLHYEAQQQRPHSPLAWKPYNEISEECKAFVQACMQQNPHNRPSARELQYLPHPFLQSAKPAQTPTSANPARTLNSLESTPLTDTSSSTSRVYECDTRRSSIQQSASNSYYQIDKWDEFLETSMDGLLGSLSFNSLT